MVQHHWRVEEEQPRKQQLCGLKQLVICFAFHWLCIATVQMRQLVEASFGSWAPPAGQPAPPQLPTPPLPDQGAISGRIFLVDLPGATQGSVAVGEPGGRAARRFTAPANHACQLPRCCSRRQSAACPHYCPAGPFVVADVALSLRNSNHAHSALLQASR